MNLRTFTICWLTILLLTISTAGARVIYVDDDSPGGDGSSWATALRYLQDALAVANANDEIRVARGIYVPDRSSVNPTGSGDRAAAFQLSETMAICGGYAGYGEPDPNVRDIEAYETILSGDLLGNDVVLSSAEDLQDEPTRNDNSYHVITADMMFATIFLSGLTVTAGHADDAEHPGPCGAGIYAEHIGLQILDCTFENNYALWAGAGIYCRHLDFMVGGSIGGCVFSGNSAGWGAAVFNDHVDEVMLEVKDCAFADNIAVQRGGAMVNYESDLNIVRCFFKNNTAGIEGGAMFNDHGDVRLTNCIISGNFAGENGGAISSEHLRVWLTNCTVVGNEAVEKGGGLFDYVDEDRRITNCIFRDNTAYEGPQMTIRGEVNAFIRHSCVQGGELDIYHDGAGSVHWADGNNTDADPCFANPGHWDTGTWVEGDYHLRSQAGRWDPNERRWTTDEVTSPCIDAGDPNSDWKAELWPHGKRVNMGAFGGTTQASMSLSNPGNVADIDVSDKVDYIDMRFLAENWLMQRALLPEDLNRDGSVNSKDLTTFAGQWLWEQ